ncbi:hypothetical protein [Streptomyces sp. NPDC048252]|uniref:hypothetical protein n=1 Tax=Streptomyces sp. NPDC048252 TaxID=3154612 RepID=UPI003445A74E
MTVGELIGLIAAAGSVLGGGGFFVARATVKAAQATARANEAAARAAAEPARRTGDLSVLQATVERVDRENEQLRLRQSRFEALLRAFSWSFDELRRWSRNPVGEPPAPHPLVDEYNRTGV